MRIFLTGSRGMVGQNILENPLSQNYDFITPGRQDLDLMDAESVTAMFVETQPDLIIHAAGHVGGIQANMKNPKEFLLRNLHMGLNVINSADTLGIKRLLNLGSSCMYPRFGENPLREEAVLTGELEPTNEGYALAKIISARLCDYINAVDSTKMYKTIIPCNLYGRYDKYGTEHSHMIPAVIRRLHDAKLSNKTSVDVWGDGSARREFMSARDLASFIFYAINNFERMPNCLNVGIGKDFSIKEYYETIARVVGFSGSFDYDTSKPVGMKRKLVDNSLQEKFGWTSEIGLKQGIEEAYDFFTKNEIL